MTKKFYTRAVLALALSGTLFSGYLSGIKLFTKTCAFNESCPYFLGYPACYFGFVMFLILLIVSAVTFWGRMEFSKGVRLNTIMASLGTIFAGYFAYPEVREILTGTLDYRFFGLTTCVYGFLFFVAMLIISICYLRRLEY